MVFHATYQIFVHNQAIRRTHLLSRDYHPSLGEIENTAAKPLDARLRMQCRREGAPEGPRHTIRKKCGRYAHLPWSTRLGEEDNINQGRRR